MKGKNHMGYSDYNIIEGENKSLYYVKENKTGQIIESFKNFNEARKFMVSLNKGAGFNGWTPNFFLKNIGKIDSFV